MQEKIKVNLSKDHIFECETNILGREGEGNTAQLEITIPEELCSCSVYLDFKKPNGEKLRTPKLEVENGVAYYTVAPYLLTDEGEVQVQAVLKTTSGGTWKTIVKKYYNDDSINAEDYINDYPEKEDFLSNAQRVLDELSGKVAEIANSLANDTDFANVLMNHIDNRIDTAEDEVVAIKETIGLQYFEEDDEFTGGKMNLYEFMKVFMVLQGYENSMNDKAIEDLTNRVTTLEGKHQGE